MSLVSLRQFIMPNYKFSLYRGSSIVVSEDGLSAVAFGGTSPKCVIIKDFMRSDIAITFHVRINNDVINIVMF